MCEKCIKKECSNYGCEKYIKELERRNKNLMRLTRERSIYCMFYRHFIELDNGKKVHCVTAFRPSVSSPEDIDETINKFDSLYDLLNSDYFTVFVLEQRNDSTYFCRMYYEGR